MTARIVASAALLSLAFSSCTSAPADSGNPPDKMVQGDGKAGAEEPGGSVEKAIEEPAPWAPCADPGEGRVYDLCITTNEADLIRLHSGEEGELEIIASVQLDGVRYEDVELELHGSASRFLPKRSYRVRFAEQRPSRDFFGDGDGDGAGKAERLVLQAAWIDPSFLRNKLIFDAVRELGGLAPRVGFARVFLNGQPNGLYQIIERVDENFLKRHGLSRDGNLYKAENNLGGWLAPDEPLLGFSEKTNEDGEASDLGELFRAVADTEPNFEAFELAVASKLSMSDFMIWHLVMSYALNEDAFKKNHYLYHDPSAVGVDRGGMFRIIPWDADSSFGLWWDGTPHPDPAQAFLFPDANELARRLFPVAEYRRQYLSRYQAALRGTLASSVLRAKAAALLMELEPFIRADLELWQRETSFDAEQNFLDQMIELRGQTISRALQAEQG